MAAPTILQSATAGAPSGSVPTNLLTTLAGAGTNGNHLVFIHNRVTAPGGSTVPATIDGESWTILENVTLTSESLTHCLIGILEIDSLQNSVDINWVTGGTTENCCCALFEIASAGGVEIVVSNVDDISGTGQTVVLTAVPAFVDDIVIAAAHFHDDDGATPAWSNSFVQQTEVLAISGAPDQSLRTSLRTITSDADYATTLSFGTPPVADQRDGSMIVIRNISTGGNPSSLLTLGVGN